MLITSFPLPSGGENIKVFVRVRPPDPHLESEVNQGPCLQVISDSTLSMHSRPEPKIFTFDTVADIHTTQVSTTALRYVRLLE